MPTPLILLSPCVSCAGAAVVPIMTPSFGFPYLVFNTKEGVLASQPLRQAVQAALGPGEMMAAAFGDSVSVQTFSGESKQGVDEARAVIGGWLGL